MGTNKTALASVLTSILCLAALIAPVRPQDFGSDFESARDAGRAAFVENCASCHGADAKGGGPMSGRFTAKPADLTVIARSNGGVFPFDSVYRMIEGGYSGQRHLSSDMPNWDCRQSTLSVAPSAGSKRRRLSSSPPASQKAHAPTMEALLDLPCDAPAVVQNRIWSIVGYLSRIQER